MKKLGLRYSTELEDALKPYAMKALSLLFVYGLATLSPAGSITTANALPLTGAVVCSVMESFVDAKLGVRAVVFHQRDKADGPRLGSLLLAHSGEQMELEATDGRRYRGTVFRVKSCFGRGLVLAPAASLNLAEHAEFTLYPPPASQ
jgi:hypothetical protein